VPTAELTLSPRPELVRIARMMSVALARRGGLPDELLQEVRVAVGEAATRAVGVHRREGSDEPVRFAFVEDDRGYEVSVRDVGAVDQVAAVVDLDVLADDADGDLPAELELALIRGMADELSVAADAAGGTLVTFRWHR
jgi:anti-sigma regulatory factor (Ser/Thr protein kinase)